MKSEAPRPVKPIKLSIILSCIISSILFAVPIQAVDVITNGSFDTGIQDWNASIIDNNGNRSWQSGTVGQTTGSIQYLTDTGRRFEFELNDSIYIPTVINSTDQVLLSFYWYKYAAVSPPQQSTLTAYIVLPDGSSTEVWTETTQPAANNSLDGNVVNLDISSSCTQTGNYYLRFYIRLRSGSSSSSYMQANLDNIILDVSGAGNNIPSITPGATTVSPVSINKIGTNSTTISADFTDSDSPGAGAFTATFKVREPDNSTELILVNNQPNGSGGLTITDNGGGSYTASYTWDPGDVQTVGSYDLYFEVSDGTDTGIDDYPGNPDELNIYQQYAPAVTPGATTVSVSPVNRYGTNSTVISTSFTDTDIPGTGAFSVTYAVREPDNSTILTLVNAQTNGNGGLTITDQGGGNYTASYTFNPDDVQTLGLYDLYFEVSDGTDNVIDGYTANPDELEINEVLPNNPPIVTGGATAVSPTIVNRLGSNSTTISTDFTDTDLPGANAFTVTFNIREPDNSTILSLVSAQTNGNGGLTVTDNGGGSYTASYTYDPIDLQTLGDYDLYFEVSDGTDNAIDDYTSNMNELNIYQQTAPVIVSGATQVSGGQVNRYNSNNVLISAQFTDNDEPGINSFNVTFRVREPDNSTEVILANAQGHGAGGVTITDEGSGLYTASYLYNPDDNQTLGLYDLYFEVNDGTDNAVDAYSSNADELEVFQQIAPSVIPGATTVSVSPVARSGFNSTTISTTFTDADQPGAGAFTVTFAVREPDNSTIVTLVNAQTNGNGGLTVIDNGGGSYTASYDWDPITNQALGLYDLYFEVTDGTDTYIDNYNDNLDELEVINNPIGNSPVIAPSATQVSVTPLNRIGTNTTVLSTQFTDPDQPAVGTFTVTFKIREPNNSTELILVNNQPDGSGGLTISDLGGGAYNASYTYDPADGQAVGLYDLYCEVNDGSNNAIDDFTDNLDELELTSQSAPTVIAGATAASKTPVNRIGTDNVVISTDFTDADQPGINSFTVTMKIREPDNSTELILVNGLTTGNGGLTVIDNGGGSYTASYTYDPLGPQTVGWYDLYFDVSDGTASAIDDFTNNLDELEIIDLPPNSIPSFVAGATQVSVSPVNRYDNNTTVISATFTDTDQPGINAFTVTLKVREPDNSTELILVNALTTGNGGLTITDNSGGSYTASYTYDPDVAQTLGLYDLFCEVSDGVDNAIDDYTNNLDELEINEIIPPTPPTLATSAVNITTTPVNRLDNNTTTIYADFSDINQHPVSSFTVTFKIRKPDNITELILVNAQTNGNGGLTITDNGNGNYTALYSYDPDIAQTLGQYDLYVEVDDGLGPVVDGYTNNPDELQINEVISNATPVVVAGVTAVSLSPVNRFGLESSLLTADFFDSDQSGISNYNITFKIRYSDNTEYILVDDLLHGFGGVTITDNGGGNYTASYDFDPNATQPTGVYDLYFLVRDKLVSAEDGYANNLDELEVIEQFPNNVPTIDSSAVLASKSPITRVDTDSSVISCSFYDADIPGVNAFTVTFKLREPDNSTEQTIVNAQTNGNGGLTIIELGAGSGVYRAEYTYDPPLSATIGLYDLYVEISDGEDVAVDGYINNEDELDINAIVPNYPPAIATGVTTATPSSVDRFGTASTILSFDFTDANQSAVSAFFITIKTRSPFNQNIYIVADNIQHGTNSLTVTDNGGGSYTASIPWNPPDNALLGYYDLEGMVSDGALSDIDIYADNPDELLLTNGGENSPPVVPSDAVFASPGGVERIGANNTTLSATFTDGDSPGINAFTVNFKLRHPDNSSELLIATNAIHNTQGVTITDDGGGIYTASVNWDPPDAQTQGYYDLYFDVSDGTDISYDFYSYNEDELEVYDAVSNNPPTLTAGNTFVLPTTISRLGSEFTMIKTSFSDTDLPGAGSFIIDIDVRDPALAVTSIVSGANHGTQGLRVTHVGGGTYEASVLWDPPEGQVIGTYDLQVTIDDSKSGVVTDDFTSNADELTVTSDAILGDGHLLRRTNDAGNCGGANSACHNISDHQNQNCRVCHTPHGTANIYLIDETIQTPNSGPKTVLFKTLGIGDPYNDPDPVEGDDNAGSMADDNNAVQTEVCEVCHTTTKYYRNDDSHASRDHHNVEDCVTLCHPHDGGFAPSAGAESSGGSSCTCHSSIFSSMDSTSIAHRHILANTDANYSPGASGVYTIKNCLTCHVDHDIFRPDINVGIGQRAKNLRMDWAIDPVLGDNTVLNNSDYSSTGNGGICLSCHAGNGCTSCHSAHKAPASPHEFISKTDYDAATSAHNYTIPITYSGDGSIFDANCTKCHNDNMSKSYQSSANQVSLHGSDFTSMLDSAGITGGTEYLEESFCFKCHSTTSNPNAGSNLDFFGLQAMTNSASLDIEAMYTKTYGHPTLTYSGRHTMADSSLTLADGNRHAECVDCHNPHAAQQGTHDGTTTLVSNALRGVWGVEPTSWPAAPTPSDNANVFAAPTAYNKLEPAQREYQICLKCHSNYTTLPTGARNLAEEINPNYPSTHGITIANQNSFCNSTTMLEPWGSSGLTYCSDCHRSDTSSDPEGPHGSNVEHLLVASIVSDDVNGTPLCDNCHRPSVYWSGDATASRFSQHPSSRSAHRYNWGCFACHMWDYASTAGLGVPTDYWDESAGGTPPANAVLFVHGQNKIWNYRDRDGTAGTGQLADAFVNGLISDMDYTNSACWSEVCRSHSNTGY